MKPSQLIKSKAEKTKISGIYMIYCPSNDKAYIGQSISIVDRWYHHNSLLKADKHPNAYLQNIFNKHLSLEYYILESCEKSILTDREKHYVELIDKECLLNLQVIGEHYYKDRVGEKHQWSEEKKQWLIEKNKAQVWTDEMKKKISDVRLAERDPDKLEIVRNIKIDIENELTNKEIALKYNMNPRRISDIRTGRKWRNT